MSVSTALRARSADRLRPLYLFRFAFAVVWAIAFAAAGASLDGLSIALLVIYPALDLAAVAWDARTSRNPVLYVNMALSGAAVIGLAIASADDVAAVLRVWGLWAILSGLAQLSVALHRRATGGQGAMIVSGGLSTLAGIYFLGQASSAGSMRMCAGYAALGGVFFLISALRLPARGGATIASGSR